MAAATVCSRQTRQVAETPGVRVVLLTDRARLDQVRDLVVAGNGAQMADAAFMAELKQWLRFSPNGAMASGDGLFSAASGNPVLPEFLGGLAFELFLTAASENDEYARQIDSSAGIAIFLAEREDKAHWIAVGRAYQRFALAATALGLKHAFVNQPVEVAHLRPELATLIGERGSRPDALRLRTDAHLFAPTPRQVGAGVTWERLPGNVACPSSRRCVRCGMMVGAGPVRQLARGRGRRDPPGNAADPRCRSRPAIPPRPHRFPSSSAADWRNRQRSAGQSPHRPRG
jgi:hypothetical protein